MCVDLLLCRNSSLESKVSDIKLEVTVVNNRAHEIDANFIL